MDELTPVRPPVTVAKPAPAARLAARLIASLKTWPDPAGWLASLVAGCVTLAAMGALGLSTGLYSLHPANLTGLPLRLLTVAIVPALGEEAVFRGLLVPGRGETDQPGAALALATGVFVIWHLTEAETFLGRAAPMFERPDFLACAAVLGLGCGWIRWRTGSLWPAVGLHWTMVTIWQTWLGGFIL